jgi:hypothetical protein
MPVGEAPEIAIVKPASLTTGGLVAQVEAVQNAVPVMFNLVGTPDRE